MKHRMWICVLLLFLCSCSPVPTGEESEPIITTTATAPPAPIEWPDMIEKWMPEELSEPRSEEITHILLHFMSDVIANPQNPYDIDKAYDILQNAGVSVHYIIDRQGTIYALVPPDRIAWHAGKGTWKGNPAYENRMNRYAIGIELLGMGTKEEMSLYLSADQYDALSPEHIGFTSQQYKALSELIPTLAQAYPAIRLTRDFVIGHNEYSPNKNDPGSLFDWSKLSIAWES